MLKKKERQNTRRLSIFNFVLILLVNIILLLVGWKYWSLEIKSHHALKPGTTYYLNVITFISIFGASLFLFGINRFIKVSGTIVGVVFAIALVLFTSFTQSPNIHMSEEREIMERVSDDLLKGPYKTSSLYVNHIWFFWSNDLPKTNERFNLVTMENLDKAKKGDLCVWENHYSHRLAGDVQASYFAEHKEWVLVASYEARKKSFRCFVYEKVEDPKKDGLSVINKFSKVHPNRIEPILGYANYYSTHDKNMDSAAHYYSEAFSMDTSNLDVLFRKGVMFFSAKQYDQAIEDFKLCLSHKSDWPEPWMNIGSALINQKKADEALEAFNKAIEYKPEIPKAHVYRATTYLMLKDTVNAMKDFSAELEINSREPQVWIRRGQLYYQQQNWEAAKNDLLVYSKLNTKRNPNLWMMIGICQLNTGEKEMAKQSLLKAKEMGHPSAQAYIQAYCN